MLKVFKHKKNKNDFVLVDTKKQKPVVNSHGFIKVISLKKFDSVREDIFLHDYELDNENSNKEFIDSLKGKILKAKKERYEKHKN